MDKIQLAPSVLSADFSAISDAVSTVERCGLSLLHLDVMDGHFVPNLTFGPKFIKDLRKHTDLVFDCHLMVEKPEELLDEYIEAGADMLTVHLESTVHIHRVLQRIREKGVKPGISIVPSTPVSALLPILDMVDLVLVMTVNPGFGGQKLIQSCLNKVAELKALRSEEDYTYLISVDGGVNINTIEDVASAGADIAVCGSAFFNAEDPEYFTRTMEELSVGTR
jgi:ribulose-phosphate 3-epimerase